MLITHSHEALRAHSMMKTLSFDLVPQLGTIQGIKIRYALKI